MAPSQRSDLNDEAPRNLARLLLLQHREAPPVDVERLLKHYADVETLDLPVSGDAVVERSLDRRPRVFLQASANNPARRRFTMAHELGHLIVPWQIGSLVCHTDFARSADDATIEIFEREANAFASEVLVPEYWLRQRLSVSGDDLTALVCSTAVAAQVSLPTAMLAVSRCCPDHSRCFFVTDDATGLVRYRDFARGGVTLPPRWSSDAADRLESAGATISCATVGGQTVWCIRFTPRGAQRARNSSVVRDEIFRKLGFALPARRTLTHQVSGIVSAANVDRLNQGLDDTGFRSAIARRFLNRNAEITAFAGHALFREFVDAVANELGTRGRRVR